VIKAKAYATAAHKAQVRKYTNEPYIVHPVEVMEIVMTVNHDEAMLSAALLHDVVEDTECTIEDIHREFGTDVALLVDELTDVSKPEDGNRAHRKALDREHSAMACPRAQTVKLADLISNARDIVKHDPKFAKVFLHEKRQLLKIMTTGDETLYAIALSLV
jgi:(p)ppGpp synthase/HD superfamily hydrolase